MSATPNQMNSLTSSPEMSLDISSSAEEKRSNNDESPTSSISSKSSITSAASQGSRGNPSTSLPNASSKTGSPTPASNSVIGNTPSSYAPTPGKAAAPLLDNSKLPIPSIGSVKGNLLPCSSSKVTVMMPATSSCPLTSNFPLTVPSILSKADSSASFASVCGRSDNVQARLSAASVEKTYPTNMSSAVTSSELSNRFSSGQSLCNRNSPQSSNSTVNVKSVIPASGSQILAKAPLLQDDGAQITKPNSTSTTASKALLSKTVGTAGVKPRSGTTSNSVTVKSAADSSLVTKAITGATLNRVSSGVNPSQIDGCSNNASSSVSNPPSTIPSCKDIALASVSQGSYGPVLAVNSKASSLGPVGKNSYDEAIEACISKYSSEAQSSNMTPRSVITTPKKRHRMEMQGKPGGGKGKESEASVHSTTSASALKRSNSRTVASALPSVVPSADSPQPFVQTKLSPPLPTPQALSPGGSKLPESGIFEPSSSSEHFIVNVSLPATPVKSVIAGLSKLKGATTSGKAMSTPPVVLDSSTSSSLSQDSYALTCHNLRQKKSYLNSLSEEEPQCSMEDSTPMEISRISVQSATEQDLSSGLIIESDSKVKIKPKSKVKDDDDRVEKISSTDRKIEGDKIEEPTTDADNTISFETSTELREVRIHVQKLENIDILSQKGKDTDPKQSKSNSKVPKRRRKCNRTGFPVKRKKKKKEATSEDLIPEVDSPMPGENFTAVPPEESLKTPHTLPSSDGNEQRSSTRVQNRKEQLQKRECHTISVPVQGEITPKEELCYGHSNTIKVEHKEESQSVILNNEDCTPNARDTRDIKQETRALESTFVHNGTPDVKASAQNCSIRTGESVVDELLPVPYIDRIPNKEKYMYAGFTKRLDAKPNNKKVRKPSKAVIRAMRAKFSENFPLPEVPSGSAKGAKLIPSTWSSDESDDSIDPFDIGDEQLAADADNEAEASDKHESYELTLKHKNGDEVIKPEGDTSRRRPKRDMKRHANSTCDEPLKSKCAKFGKEGGQNNTTNRIKPNSIDSRTRNKRKNETEDIPTSSELRSARSKKRLRTVQRMEADSADTDW